MAKKKAGTAGQSWQKPDWNKQGKTAYINARLIDPATGLDSKGALLTDGMVIKDFGQKLFNDGVPEGIEVIDCGGHVLMPGIIDLQVHFREPGQEHKETLETGTKSAAAGGVTMAVCQPNTKPVIDSVPIVEFINKRVQDTGYMHVKPYASISVGMKGEAITEMAMLKEAGAVGFTDDGLPVMNSLLMRRALEYSKMLNVPIAQHAEDINLSNGGAINEGKVAIKLGVLGIPNVSESIIVERDIQLVELTGGYYHLLHASTRQSIEAIRRAKKKGLNVTCEAAPHHFWLTDEAVLEHKANAKMNPPLRSKADCEAIIEGLKDGTVDAIATDHAPHELEMKDIPLSSAAFGIVGVETLLPLSLKLYHDKHLSLIEVLKKLTCNAANIIHEPAGRLKKGLRADLTLVDINHGWVIEPKDFASKSKNSPFGGMKVKGRAIRTVVNGSTVYELSY